MSLKQFWELSERQRNAIVWNATYDPRATSLKWVHDRVVEISDYGYYRIRELVADYEEAHGGSREAVISGLDY